MRTSSRDRHLRRGWRALGTAALALTTVLGLAACDGGADEAAGSPPGSPSATASGSPSGSPSGPPSGSPSGSTSASGAGVAPATGELVDTSYFTARVPKGYQVSVMGKDFSIAANGPGGQLGFAIIPLQGHDLSLMQAARNTRKFAYGLHHAPLGRTTSLGGEPAYLLLDREPGINYSDVGLDRQGYLIHVGLTTFGTTRAEHLRLLDSVLASWQWK